MEAVDRSTAALCGTLFFGLTLFFAECAAVLFFKVATEAMEVFFVAVCGGRAGCFFVVLLFAAGEEAVFGFAALRTGAFSAFVFLGSGLEWAELSVSLRLLVVGAERETFAAREAFLKFLVTGTLIERFV